MEHIPGRTTRKDMTIAKDKDGYEYDINFWNAVEPDLKSVGVALSKLQTKQKFKRSGLAFVIAPMKLVRPGKECYGVPYNDGVKEAEMALRWLRYYHIPYLDLRNSSEYAQMNFEDVWSKTNDEFSDKTAEILFDDIMQWYESADYAQYGFVSAKNDSVLLISDDATDKMEDYFAEKYSYVDQIGISSITKEKLNQLLDKNTYDHIFVIVKPENIQAQYFNF